MRTFAFFLSLFWLITLLGCQKNACLKLTCLNGGTCTEGVCSCPDGYAGKTCEIKIDKCQQLGCDTLHSDCDPNSAVPKCICHEGWEGEKCDRAWSDKFLGENFVASQICDGSSEAYSVQVMSGTKFNSFVIANFHNKASSQGTSKILCELRTPYNFIIYPQPMYYGYVQGRGELSANNKYLDVVYTVVPLNTTDTMRCEAVLERQ